MKAVFLYAIELLDGVQLVCLLGQNRQHLLVLSCDLNRLYDFNEVVSGVGERDGVFVSVASDIFDQREGSPWKIDCDFH